MAGKFFTDTEIDEILVAIDDALEKSNLAKSEDANENLEKAVGDLPEDKDAGDAPAMDSAPMAAPEEAAAEQPPVDAEMPEGSDEMAPPQAEGEGEEGMDMEGEGMPEPEGEGAPEGDQALEEEGHGEIELSDEELHEIYASMDPSELERHYMIIRGLLREQYAKAEEVEKCGEMDQVEKKEEVAKSEDQSNSVESSEESKRIEELEKSKKELEESLEGMGKALELLCKPERKAVTSDVEFVKKSEDREEKTLTKAEIFGKLNEMTKDTSLAKSDREVIDSYFLNGQRAEDQASVLEILRRK